MDILRPRQLGAIVVAIAALPACASRNPPAAVPVSTATVAVTTASPTTADVTTTQAPTTTQAVPTTAASTSSTSTSIVSDATPAPPTTSPPSTIAAPTTAATAQGTGAAGPPWDLTADRVTVGWSVQGREIVAERSGTVGGRRILIIGVIHGNEPAGTLIVNALRTKPIPENNELWLIESMNPDGQAISDRQNANQVDLNRNFPYGWEPLGQPGDGQYGGTGPASEPETQAMVAFITELRPDIVIWYHQDLDVIAPADGRDGQIRQRYAELTGMQIASEPFNYTGARYTGVAATWARNSLAPIGSVPFVVELGPSLSSAQADVHAQAIVTIAAEL